MKTHEFDVGDRVAVINQTYKGKFFVEGYATIKKRLSAENRYLVQFPDGFGRYHVERFVDPAAQADPQAYVDLLNASQKCAAPRS